jgi:hypothetical protein
MNARPQMNTIVATLPITIPAMAPDDNVLRLGGCTGAVLLEDAGVVVTVVGAAGVLLPTGSDDVLPVVVVSSTVLVYPEIVAQP